MGISKLPLQPGSCLVVSVVLLVMGGCVARSTGLHHVDPATRVLYWSKAIGTELREMPMTEAWRTSDPDPLADPRITVVEVHPGADPAEARDYRLIPRKGIAERDDLVEVTATVIRLVPGFWRGEKIHAEDAMAVFSVTDAPLALRPLRELVLCYRDHDGRFRPFKMRHSYTFRFTPEGEFFDVRVIEAGLLGHVGDRE